MFSDPVLIYIEREKEKHHLHIFLKSQISLIFFLPRIKGEKMHISTSDSHLLILQSWKVTWPKCSQLNKGRTPEKCEYSIFDRYFLQIGIYFLQIGIVSLLSQAQQRASSSPVSFSVWILPFTRFMMISCNRKSLLLEGKNVHF